MEGSSRMAGVLALALAAGCEQDKPTPPIVPPACLQNWAEEGYNTESDYGLKLTPSTQIDPELKAAESDVHALVGFAASFVASQNQYAVSPDSLQSRADFGDLSALAFQGELPSDVDLDTVFAGELKAPSVHDQVVDGQLDAEFDLSGGVADDMDSDWSWESSYGTAPSTWHVMFLDGNCEYAVPDLEGRIATEYEVSPEGVNQSN